MSKIENGEAVEYYTLDLNDIIELYNIRKYFKNNIKKLWLLKDDYAIKYNFSFLNFILKQSYRKTKDQMQDFMQMNKLRFYNNSSERTYMEKPSWESWDTNYIIIHTIIFFLACFYGR